ncbi:MAG: replicative DNA helicase [bacterium]|nr:replicative DNA helicase [bacterium]
MDEQRVPPQDLDAEQSVLGAVLLDKDAIIRAAEVLRPHHFYNPRHEDIFTGMLVLFEKREPIDIVTLTAELKHRKVYARVGGAVYLAELAEKVPTAANVEHYAEIVRERATRRALIAASSKIAKISFEDTEETRAILDTAERAIFDISNEYISRDFTSLKALLDISFEKMDELMKHKGQLRGVKTGYRDLDEKLAGLQDSNLIILAARPAIGKTSLAVNIAHHVATHEKVPVGIFSLEMSQEELTDRLVVNEADIDAWRWKTGNLEEDDYDRISRAMGELAEVPLYIDDTPGISLIEMRTKARRLQIEKGLKLLIVDYLQLIHGRNLENRVQEVSEISMGLKNLARELKIPVLALSQLSRAVESRGNPQPQLADLRESGSIEQDADVVLFLYKEDPENAPEQITLDIAKHRNGPTGRMSLIFRGDRIRFYGMEKKRQG